MVKVKKSLSDRYTILNIGHGGASWANIIIDESWGLLCIHSDWGNWSFAWSHHGCNTFREFLLGSRPDPHYFMNKLAAGKRYFDEDATLKEIKRQLIETRRETPKSFSKEDARDAWNEAENIDANSADSFGYQLYECEKLREFVITDMSDWPAVTTLPPALQEFFKEAWPHFLDEIEKEIPPVYERSTVSAHQFNGA